MSLTDPVSERPHAPGYEVPESGDGLLPFTWARQRLADATTWWVASVRPDSRPHVMPIWGAWVDDRGYLLGQLSARWARNLAAVVFAASPTRSASSPSLLSKGPSRRWP